MFGRLFRIGAHRVADERGSVGILLALVLFFILGMLSMTYNTARLSTEKIRLQNAVDAAALEHAAWQARGMNMIQNLNNEGYTALSFAEELICISIFINDVRYGFELIADASKSIPIVGAVISGIFNALEVISYYLIRGVLFAADWFANTIAGKVIYYLQFFCQFTPVIGYLQAQQLARFNGAESIGGKSANFTVGSTTFGVYAIGVSMKSPLTTLKLPVKRAFVSCTNDMESVTDIVNQSTNNNNRVNIDSLTNGWHIVDDVDIAGFGDEAIDKVHFGDETNGFINILKDAGGNNNVANGVALKSAAQAKSSSVKVTALDPLAASDNEGVQKLNLIVDANDQSFNLDTGSPSMATASAIGSSVIASQSSSKSSSSSSVDTRALATANRKNVKAANKLKVEVPMSVGSAGMSFNSNLDTKSSGVKAAASKTAAAKNVNDILSDGVSAGEPPFVTNNNEYRNKLIVGSSKRNEVLRGKCPKFNFNPMISESIPDPCIWICYKDRAQMKLMPLNVWDQGASTKTKGLDAQGKAYARLTTGHGGIGRTIVIAAAKCVSGDIVKQSVTASGTYCFQRPAGLGAGATAKLVPVSSALPAKVLENSIGSIIFH